MGGPLPLVVYEGTTWSSPCREPSSPLIAEA